MNAGKINLLTALLGFDRRQFIIPVYQRKYKWTGEQCNRLIDDIVKAGQSGKEHFTGTVIYQEPNAGSFKKAYLVDGQQRITTILLMIKALNVISLQKKDDDEDYKYVYESTLDYLLADKKDKSRGMKLVPSKNDERIFNCIMNGASFEEISKNPFISKEKDAFLYNNFLTIYNRFITLCRDGNMLKNVILEGMYLLTIVEMSLDKEDDPQAIFESINSLGLKLSNADLIRNYLLMSSENQKELYETYWEVIQDNFIKENNMEFFVFNYLMMKKSSAINSDDVYKEYVLYSETVKTDGVIDKELLLKDLYKAAKIYQPFIRSDSNYTAETNMLMQELRDMVQSTAYPFLMKVFIDKEDGVIDEKTLDKVVNLIIVYLVRRTICSVPTHSLRGFMLNLYNRVFKVQSNKNRYFEAIYAFLSQLQTNDRLRSINEVKEALKSYELYKNIKFATYLLYKIENGRYPKPYSEVTRADDVTVEHIIPQTLTDEWIQMLGDNAEEIHSTYLNTLGNLSLSSRSKNSVMSNESFIDKRDILLTSGSKFIELNKDIKEGQTEFAEKELIDRETRLSDIVCSKYFLDSADISGIKFEDTLEIICSTDYEEVFGYSTIVAYKIFDKEYQTDSFNQTIIGVMKVLYQKYPEKMRELASNGFNPWSGGDTACIHYSYGDEDKDKLIADDIRVHVGYQLGYCIQFITLVMQEFGIDASQLIVYLKKDSIKTINILPKKERISIVRKALDELANENKILYSEDAMPKSNDWIKFKTDKLKQVFPYEDKTKWDDGFYNSISYLEYDLSGNVISITYKVIKKSRDISDKLNECRDTLGLMDKIINGTYWHMKEYPVDFKAIMSSTDRVGAMKKEIERVVHMVDEDLDKIAEVKKEN